MNKSTPGLYETLITEALVDHLDEAAQRWHVVRDALRPPEAPDRIAFHLSKVIERAVQGIGETERSEKGVELARAIVNLIKTFKSDAPRGDERPTLPPGVLRAVLSYRPDGAAEVIGSPLTPLLDTTLGFYPISTDG